MARRDTASRARPLPEPPPRPALLVAGLALTLTVIACGPDDGRHLADPDPALTAVPVPTTTPTEIIDVDPPLQGIGPGDLTLTSADFSPGATLPERSACGGSTSPRLEWTDPPNRITELALVAQDIDADGVAQWVVTGIPAEAGRVAAGEAPAGGDVRPNSAGAEAWASPCPADGFAHRIVFTLYALDQPLPAGAGDPTSVVSAVQAASAGSASLLGRAAPGITEPG